MKLPLEQDILTFIESAETPATKRELVRAFNIKGDNRRPFKAILSQLESNGLIIRQSGGRYSLPDGLPAVTSIEITEISVDGDVFAKPIPWNEDLQGPFPRIEIMPDNKGQSALTVGDEAVVRISKTEEKNVYTARLLKRMETPDNQILGLVVLDKKGYRLVPTDRKARYDFDISEADLNGAEDGDLAFGVPLPSQGQHTKRVKIKQVVGHENDPKVISLIAIHEAGLSLEFPSEVINETKNIEVPPLGNREDLRDIPLVTIDGADARDFDDAVFAEKNDDGGFHLIVAIADVSYYVKYGSHLDREAWTRGNSTYFPDRVVPMLPEQLSNNLCSLMPKVERACVAVHMTIDKDGELVKYKFVRGLMKSTARLTYDQVQAAKDGNRDNDTDVIYESVIVPLYEAYDLLDKARQKRGALDLDLPERQILINDEGDMTGVIKRPRYDSHKLIETFMIMANVAAASALEDKNAPCIYRTHDKPSGDKIDSAKDFLNAFGFSLPANIVEPKQINHLLELAKGHEYSQLISLMVLRTQAQARYSPENIGHFGLALHKYAHFTSPIRRYADLFVHRSLISAYNLGSDGLGDGEEQRIGETAEHISATERVSSDAERSSVDRFTAAYLESRVNAEFSGVINGVTRFGLFVTLDEIGADGLVPIRTLPQDYYVHDEEQHALIGRKTRRIFRLGARVRIRVIEAEKLSGSTVFELVDAHKGADIPGFKPRIPLKNDSKTPKSKTSFKKKTATSYGNKSKHKGSPKKKKRK